jgi:hypothetical protein
VRRRGLVCGDVPSATYVVYAACTSLAERYTNSRIKEPDEAGG